MAQSKSSCWKVVTKVQSFESSKKLLSQWKKKKKKKLSSLGRNKSWNWWRKSPELFNIFWQWPEIHPDGEVDIPASPGNNSALSVQLNNVSNCQLLWHFDNENDEISCVGRMHHKLSTENQIPRNTISIGIKEKAESIGEAEVISPSMQNLVWFHSGEPQIIVLLKVSTQLCCAQCSSCSVFSPGFAACCLFTLLLPHQIKKFFPCVLWGSTSSWAVCNTQHQQDSSSLVSVCWPIGQWSWFLLTWVPFWVAHCKSRTSTQILG